MSKLKEIAEVFFKLGCIAFGGPAAHIAMMDDEIVEKRKWMSRQHFLDLIGITNLIPGPNSTEMTMHCGYERGGWKGLFIAGSTFILPAVIITCFIAYLYKEYGQLPQVEPFIYGIKPAVIAIILAAAYKLGKKALKSGVHVILAIITTAICLMGYNEILVMFGMALFGIFVYFIQKPGNGSGKLPSFFPIAVSIPALKTFLIFLKVGAILYGSGYVLFAFLDAELVAKGLLTKKELMDAVAVGQITPGPVLSTASFIGWQLGGWKGAAAATVGIFLPSFIFVGLINPLVHRIRKSPALSAFLDALNAAAIAVILAVCIEMGIETITDYRTIIIAIVSLILVFGFKKMHAAYVVLLGSVLGWILWVI